MIKNYSYGIQSLGRKLLRQPVRKPLMISVEPTNLCNLNCPFCLVGMQNEQASVAHSELGRPWGQIDLALFEKIAKEAKDFGIITMQLHFQGEPLIHKRFVELLNISKKYKLRTQFFTNGLLLNPEISREILRAGADSIRFSVDGATQEIYQQNRVGGKLETVYQNMSDMVRIAKEEKSPAKLVWQFIVMRNNEHELEMARSMADKIGIQFLAKTYAESVPSMAPLNPQYRRVIHPKPCQDIYRMILVYWSGEVVPCCYDQVGKEVMGNLKNQSLREIWEGDKYQDFRRRTDDALDHPESEPELCKSCLKWGNVDSKIKGRSKELPEDV